MGSLRPVPPRPRLRPDALPFLLAKGIESLVMDSRLTLPSGCMQLEDAQCQHCCQGTTYMSKNRLEPQLFCLPCPHRCMRPRGHDHTTYVHMCVYGELFTVLNRDQADLLLHWGHMMSSRMSCTSGNSCGWSRFRRTGKRIHLSIHWTLTRTTKWMRRSRRIQCLARARARQIFGRRASSRSLPQQ